MIRDGESGLVLCPERIESVYLFSPGANRPPAFEFDFADYGFGISIQPRETPRNLEILARIASLFGDAVVPASDLIARGAGSWLDEWGHLEQSASEGSTDARVSGTAAEGKIAAQIVTPGFEAEIAMRPAFEDRDGQIRRIAAAGGCDAIVIDADVLVIGDGRVDQWDGRQLLQRRAEQLRSEVTTR